MEETGADAVGEVVERVSGIVRPIHDLALDGFERIALLAGREFGGEIISRQRPIEKARLRVVDEMVFRRRAAGFEFGPERLVFQDAIEERARGIHARMLGGKDALSEQAQGLGVALEAAVPRQQVVERALARMAEGRVAEIVGKADRLDQVGVNVETVGKQRAGLAQQPGGDGFSDLRDLQRVGEAGAVEVVFAGPTDLGLVL